MTDDGGVLGNLPRSRPGRRSEKRTGKEGAEAKRGAAGPAKTSARTASRAERDPVGDALRTVTGLAATGARVANGVAREVLRRLPRR